MEAYTSFAQVYDMFMDNVPYDEWADYIRTLLKEHGINDGIILELGCGTGSLTRRLRDYGYEMIALDNSEEMLSIAKDNSSEDILFLLQDMTEFELYGTVDAVVCICDSMNYIMDEDDLLEVFRLVNNYLEKDGVFIFDMNTIFKYKTLLADNTIAENRDEGSFIWDNYYDEDEMINEYDLTLYIKESNDMYKRFEETHYQRAYSIETIKRLLVEAGLVFENVYKECSHDEANEECERVYFVAREGFQEGKVYNRCMED